MTWQLEYVELFRGQALLKRLTGTRCSERGECGSVWFAGE